MTARRLRWMLAGFAIVAELVSFVAWRLWVMRQRPPEAAPTEPAPA